MIPQVYTRIDDRGPPRTAQPHARARRRHRSDARAHCQPAHRRRLPQRSGGRFRRHEHAWIVHGIASQRAATAPERPEARQVGAGLGQPAPAGTAPCCDVPCVLRRGRGLTPCHRSLQRGRPSARRRHLGRHSARARCARAPPREGLGGECLPPILRPHRGHQRPRLSPWWLDRGIGERGRKSQLLRRRWQRAGGPRAHVHRHARRAIGSLSPEGRPLAGKAY